MGIGILIAAAEELVRTGFRMILEAEDDFEVLGEASNGTEAVEMARLLQPEVILMDIRMPGMDGLEATKRIAADESTPSSRVLILTTFDEDEYVYGALCAGASGFLLKRTPAATLVEGIRVIANGCVGNQQKWDTFVKERSGGNGSVVGLPEQVVVAFAAG